MARVACRQLPPGPCSPVLGMLNYPAGVGAETRVLLPGQATVGPELGLPTKAAVRPEEGVQGSLEPPSAGLLQGNSISGRNDCLGQGLEAGGRGYVQVEQRGWSEPGFSFTCLTAGCGPLSPHLQTEVACSVTLSVGDGPCSRIQFTSVGDITGTGPGSVEQITLL